MLRGFHHHKNFSNLLGAGRGSVSLGAWFGFAFLRQFFASFAVKKNLTAKNAKESQRTQSKSLGQGANCTTT